jgi:hypothetical protein
MPPAIHQIKYLPSCARNTRETHSFPFLIFYAEFDELIWIIAIAHGKRKPNYLID